MLQVISLEHQKLEQLRTTQNLNTSSLLSKMGRTVFRIHTLKLNPNQPNIYKPLIKNFGSQTFLSSKLTMNTILEIHLQLQFIN